MLMVRLQRVGRKNDPSFRVVLTDSKNSTKSGRFLEVLGSYNARFGKPQIEAERVKYWMSVGAQLTPTVHNLLINEKMIAGKKINVLPHKSPPKKEETVSPEVVVESPTASVASEEKQEDAEVKS